jgi:hypothetical protein
VASSRAEVTGQRADDRWCKVLNIEQQNKEQQNDEVNTSIFPPEADSTFCGSERVVLVPDYQTTYF